MGIYLAGIDLPSSEKVSSTPRFEKGTRQILETTSKIIYSTSLFSLNYSEIFWLSNFRFFFSFLVLLLHVIWWISWMILRRADCMLLDMWRREEWMLMEGLKIHCNRWGEGGGGEKGEWRCPCRYLRTGSLSSTISNWKHSLKWPWLNIYGLEYNRWEGLIYIHNCNSLILSWFDFLVLERWNRIR